MTKSGLETLVNIALASEEAFALRDEGLSLLQTRVHKHEVDQEPEYFMEANGGECKPEEALTLAQCVEVAHKRLVPHAMAAWSVLGSKRQAAGHTMPNGCSLAPGNQIEWSDQPVGTPRSGYRPVCSKNGGRAAELASQGSSCAEPTCTQDPPQLEWTDDGLYVPELEVLAAGQVCEACGILTYAQCAKAADTGLLEAAGGAHEKRWPQIQCNGGGHSRPAVPSGCYLGANFAASAMPSFCPYDTPDGALAGWVSTSGAGVGWGLARPVCGSCTTTTTTPVPPAPVPGADEAGAIGDPHVMTNSGAHFDITSLN